jgi:hypothetical protein
MRVVWMYCGACMWQGKLTRVTGWYIRKERAEAEILRMAYILNFNAMQGAVFIFRRPT